MEARQNNLLKFLDGRKQFIIPIYQRTYSWGEEQWKELFDDIVRTAQNNLLISHFIGSIVYTSESIYQISSVPQLLVIDGQQRLTTVFLILSILGKEIQKRKLEMEINRKKINSYYLFNHEEDGELKYKLLLTQNDRSTLNSLLEDKELPSSPSSRIIEAERFFSEQISKVNDLQSIYNGIKKLIIIDLSLERERDNPQLIFESLNSKGLDLSQTDLIRNYMLMKMNNKEQIEIYNDYWLKIENIFRPVEKQEYFDAFIRDYLTTVTGRIPNKDKIYYEFKHYVGNNTTNPRVKEIVSYIYTYSQFYEKIVFLKEEDKKLLDLFYNLKELEVSVSVPFLLKLYDLYQQKLLQQDDMIHILKMMETYIFRRAVCGLATNTLNKVFLTLTNMIRKTPDKTYREDLQNALLSKTFNQRFPDDEEFIQKFQTINLYKKKICKYTLEKLENFGRKEKIRLEDYTIEHIMPQNKELNPQWQRDLGEDWENIHSTYLHTVGNLTLTCYNSEFSDKSFLEKRNTEGGFKDSPLYLNRIPAKKEKWDEEEILKRANELTQRALQIWSYPGTDTLPEKNFQEIIADIFPTENDFLEAKKTCKSNIRNTGLL